MYGKKYYFRNPLKQNYAHVKALQEKLNLSEEKFIPIVVFSVNSEIKVKTSKPVVYTVKLKQIIEEYKELKFGEDELDKIVSTIQNVNITDKDSKKKHIEQIKNKINHNQNSVNDGMCPKCGGVLVKRKGKYGMFTGCSNYPKCRYTN